MRLEDVHSRAESRDWLAADHATAREAWMVTYEGASSRVAVEGGRERLQAYLASERAA